MGGCCIGQDDRTSVVNPEFTMHHQPNIHIADISTFPNAPGINPALTVYALTHRMATGLLKN
jgi:choline dehydrogenase-like flavoprotein